MREELNTLFPSNLFFQYSPAFCELYKDTAYGHVVQSVNPVAVGKCPCRSHWGECGGQRETLKLISILSCPAVLALLLSSLCFTECA